MLFKQKNTYFLTYILFLSVYMRICVDIDIRELGEFADDS